MDDLQAFAAAPAHVLARRASQYRSRPYLKGLETSGLEARRRDLLQNCWTTDTSGAAQRLSDLAQRHFVMTRYLDLLEEVQSRSGEDTWHFVSEAHLRNEATRDYQPVRLAAQPHVLGGHPLYRFGRAEHLEAALERGRFRINLASRYSDPSLNAAQQDDELSRHEVRAERDMSFQLYGPRTPGSAVEPLAHTPLELYRILLLRPFYVLCLSTQLDLRMFHDFKAEAVLIVHDRPAFLSRLDRCASAAIGSPQTAAAVTYCDPYDVALDGLRPAFTKHFRHGYQREFRVTWSAAPDAPDYVDVEIGDLRDIAQIIRRLPAP